ncbi:MAG: hypothetical protein RL038_179 [Actinomycetota bacterium]
MPAKSLLARVRDWRLAIATYLVSIPLIAAVWHFTAPRAECYISEGECVWQMDQTSSPYFFADLVFGGTVTVIALLIGWFLASKLQKSIKAQLAFAALGYAAAFAAAKLGESFNSLELLEEPYAIDALELRSTAMLFLWPMWVQMFVVFRERKSGNVQSADENSAENASTGEELPTN